MFEIKLKQTHDIRIGDGVKGELLATGKLLIRSTKGALYGITEPVSKDVISRCSISYKRPLYGVVIDVSDEECLLHMIAPGRIKDDFMKTTGAETIPFPAAKREEAA